MIYLASTFLILAALLWFALAITMAGLLTGDPLARSLAKGFTIYLGLGTWTTILGMALLATIKNGPPALAAAAALAAMCSGAALLMTSELLNNRAGSGWLIIPVVLGPAIVGWMVAGALFPRLAVISVSQQQLWLCTASVVLLSALVVPRWIAGRRANAEECERINVLKSQTAASLQR